MASDWYGGWFGESESGDGSFTDEDRALLRTTAAMVSSLGNKQVLYSDVIFKGGTITIRRGYSRKAARGNPIGPFKFDADLTDATMELRGVGPVSAFTPVKAFADGKWTVTFDLNDEDASALAVGSFTYIVAAIYPDGSELDPVERTSGVATVI